jgi:FkbM family methyltransferase
MSIQVANIIKGVLGKVTRQKSKGHFPAISWWQEKRLKHEEDRQKKVLNIGTLKIIYRRPYEVLHTYRELFEEEIYNFTASSASPFIIDCGANIGLSVLYFKRLYPGATLVAFEPDKENFHLLQENTAANQLQNVDLRQAAVWKENGTLSFSSAGTQDSQIVTNGKTANTIQIRAERLADLLKDRHVDFLKIDIEGAELEVLKDCEPQLSNVENLFVEYHGKASETEKLTQLLEILKKYYKVYLKLAADNLEHPFVTKTTNGVFDVQLNIFCYR